MKTFYCVQHEHYANGQVKAAIIERTCREKLRNQFKKLPIGDFYLDWFDTREQAEKYLAERR